MLMQCGHSAQGKNHLGQPCCVICYGIKPGALIPAPEMNLQGRKARCSYGVHADTESSINLPFFRYWPDRDMDEYYCGCHGWE